MKKMNENYFHLNAKEFVNFFTLINNFVQITVHFVVVVVDPFIFVFC